MKSLTHHPLRSRVGCMTRGKTRVRCLVEVTGTNNMCSVEILAKCWAIHDSRKMTLRPSLTHMHILGENVG